MRGAPVGWRSRGELRFIELRKNKGIDRRLDPGAFDLRDRGPNQRRERPPGSTLAR